MSFQTLEVTADGAVGRLRLPRPDQRNAISRRMLAELVEAARQMNTSPDVRVVVLEAAGPAFCAGVHLQDFESFLGEPGSADGVLSGAARAVSMAGLGHEAVTALANMRQFTIAKIRGYAVGGGAVLGMAADLRLLSDDAYIWIPEVELGTPLVWGAIPRLVAEIGPARTKDIVTTSRRVSSAEALEIGLASRVFPRDELETASARLVREMVGRARYAVEATKGHVNAVARAMSMGDTSYADGYVQAASWLDLEVRQRAEEYVNTFRQGRR